MKKYLLLTICLLFSLAFQVNAQLDFYDTDRIAEVRLNFPENNWAEALDSLVLAAGKGLHFGSASIDGQRYKNVGVRYRGTRSFKTGGNRNALYIKLNYINKNQNHQGYKTIKLSNALRDPSMVREVMSYEIARQYMPAPQANYVKVFINDKYYGLFVNIEDISDEFLTKNFGSSDDAFFKCSPNIDESDAVKKGCKNKVFASLEYEEGVQCYLDNYEIKSDDGWDDLIELTRILKKEPKKIGQVLNVDRTLWMLAFNNVLVNLSSYSGKNSQNYYLYKDINGQFNPIVWDLNLSFGSFKTIGGRSDLALRELQNLDPLLHKDNEFKPLISQLLKNPDYEKIYLSHVRSILYDHFVDGQYEKRAKELQTMITSDLYNDKNRAYDHSEYLKSLTTTIGKRSKIPGITELMGKRAKYLKKHPKLSVFPPEVSNIEVMGREKFSNQAVEKFNIVATVSQRPKRVKVYYRFKASEAYKSIYMKDDGKNNDGTAGDKTFGVMVDPEGLHDTVEYYIVPENAATVSFSPANYMYEPHKSTLKELNK